MVSTSPAPGSPPKPGRFGPSAGRSQPAFNCGSHMEASSGKACSNSNPSIMIGSFPATKDRPLEAAVRLSLAGHHDRQGPRDHRERGGKGPDVFAVREDLKGSLGGDGDGLAPEHGDLGVLDMRALEHLREGLDEIG